MRLPVPAKTVYPRYSQSTFSNYNLCQPSTSHLQSPTSYHSILAFLPTISLCAALSVQELVTKQSLALPYGQVAKVTDHCGVSQRQHSQLITQFSTYNPRSPLSSSTHMPRSHQTIAMAHSRPMTTQQVLQVGNFHFWLRSQVFNSYHGYRLPQLQCPVSAVIGLYVRKRKSN